ncbi:MAG: cysteine--tRNA ligase, partial [Candidatus Shikimatogenerans sp. JK-2022]|nr:cysteine--tRNA ligase [Candidatus Shikimatogenerans bostrichidophilus]
IPAWHISCSTIINIYLGNYIDIHGGGIDLKFPHHECEIIQSNIINNNNKNLAKYWIHTNMLTINNKKMSKSLKNIILPEDIVNGKLKILKYKKFNFFIIKFYLLQTHYRKQINFSYKNLKNAKKNYYNVINIYKKLKKIKKNKKSIIKIDNILKKIYNNFNNDFNIPLVFSNLIKINKVLNKCIYNKLNISKKNYKIIKKIYKIFIINIFSLKKKPQKKEKKIIKKIIKIREEMRKKRIYEF